MAKYWFKDGKLPKSLQKESVEKAPLLEEEEVQAAFFTGEDSTKVFDSSSVSKDEALGELFGVEEPKKKKGKVKLSAFIGKNVDGDTSEKIIKEVDEVYSGEYVKKIDETTKRDHMTPFNAINKSKKPKLDDVDGENDDYETDGKSLEGLFNDTDNDEYDDTEEDSPKAKPVKDSFREYKSPLEREEFFQNYKRKARKALVSALSCFVFTLLLFFHESPSFIHPEWLTQGKFGILYLLFDIQLLFFAAISAFDVILKGAKALFKWHPNKYSISFVLVTVSILQILLHLIFDTNSDKTILFSSIAAFSILISSISRYFDARRDGITFKALSQENEKYIAESLSDKSEEFIAFEQYLPDDPYLYSVKKTGFISNFVQKSREESSFNEIYKIILPLILFTSILFAVIANIMSGTPTFGRTLDNFVLAIMISTPVISALSVSLPFFKGVVALSKRGCSVIGEASLDECSSANIVSFKDTDAFHEKGITLSLVKPFGEAQIDTAFFTAARVFNIVGGPLKGVFNRSIIESGSSGSSEADEIIQILPNSILALIDGKKVTLGTKMAVKSQGVVISDDPVDSLFENSNGRIMYMLLDDELAAKFYIKYSLGKNFRAILDNFYDVGVFMVIKSCDPNLDSEYLTKLLKDENYPIIVTKLNQAEYINAFTATDSAPTTVFSNTSVPNLLRTFAWCDKCRKIINLNQLSKYIAIVLSIIILIACMLNANAHEKITPVLILLYQIIWSLPVLGTSLFQ